MKLQLAFAQIMSPAKAYHNPQTRILHPDAQY